MKTHTLFRLFAALVVGAAAAAAQSPNRRPNIVLIVADDLGYGELSCYGQQRFATPNIDRLAREGMRFTQHYAGSPICAPSRNTLLVGQHTGHATIRQNFAFGKENGERVPLQPTDLTIAQRLKAAGYRTGLIGKWGQGEPGTGAEPWHKGFDTFRGFINQAHAHNHYPEFLYRDREIQPLPVNFGHKEGLYANDHFTDEALEFFAAEKDRPFFLFLAYTTPHADLKCPADSIEEVKALQPWARDPNAAPSSVTFAAMVHRLDRDVGRLMARLAELGLDRDTIVIFTSDNGPHREDEKDNAFFAASGPLRGIKRDVYEGGIRVPFIARWPGKIPAGSETTHVSAFWDFPATALELAGLPQDGLPADGISYGPTLLQRPGQRQHDHLYWELRFKDEGRQAVRSGDWKAVRFGPDEPIELYHLGRDLGETRNVAAEHPDIVTQMAALMQSSRTESPHFPLHAPKQNKAKKK